jgi:hypothetical protein
MMRRLRTSEDIEKLEGHVTKVDPLANPLNRIIEHYYIHPFSIKCGLSGCGQTHKEGCLVELEDLSITNIGHLCGKRFGEKFDRERARNYESEYKPRLLQTITQAQARLASDHFKLHEANLRASDLVRHMDDFTKMFPDLVGNLRRRAYSNISDVSESVERSEEEIDDLMAANRFQSRESLAFKEKHVGTINGFRFPMHDWSMATGLRKLFAELTKFSELRPRSLPMADLQRWAHWADDFDDNLARTMKGIEDGDNFFSTANFQLCAVLEPAATMKAKLRSLQVDDISSPRPAATHHLSKPSSTPKPKPKPKSNISLRELRRLTGNKKGR